MSLFEFFESVYNGRALERDIIDGVKEFTNGYREDDLIILIKDFDAFYSVKRIEAERAIDIEELQNEINFLHAENEQIPYKDSKTLYVSDFISSIDSDQLHRRYKYQNELKNIDQSKILNVESLMYPNHFLLLEWLKKYLLKLLFEDLYSDKIQIQPINWLSGEESLRQFIDSLKSAGLIENRETDEIIQEHFRQSDKKPQPIKWSKSNRLINYLFWQLREAGLIDKERKYKIITEHFLNRHGKPLKRDSLKNDIDVIKYDSPKGSKVIDNIIESLHTKPLQ